MNAIDRAAIEAAYRLRDAQPQMKFIGNIASSLAPLAPALSFIPGVGPAIAAGIGGASALFGGGGGNGQPQGGGGFGGALGSLASTLGPAAAINAIVKANQAAAEQSMNNAASRQTGATNDYANALLRLYGNMHDPALSSSVRPTFAQTNMPRAGAPQIGSIGGRPVTGLGSAAPMASTLTQPTFTPPSQSPIYTGPSSGLPLPGANAGGVGTSAPASQPGSWSPFLLNENHATGYQRQTGPNMYQYRGPDNKVYDDSYAGEVRPGDVQKNYAGMWSA